MALKPFISDARYVCAAGDMHGDYKSFCNIVRIHKEHRKKTLLVFLGDYADRGAFGLEIISELNSLLDKDASIVALKGNHEIYDNGVPSFFPCDLVCEAERKYGSWDDFYLDVMKAFLSKLHIAALINNVLFIHAGISSAIETPDDLSDPKNEKLLLWSDPAQVNGEHPSPRGAGVTFGEDITKRVLASLNMRLIVRSHEPGKAAHGPYVEHDGKVITVNSCSYYGEPFILKIDTISLDYKPLLLKR